MRICAIIVTFNRCRLLEQVISTFDNLENGADHIIVVNNNSTDETKSILEQWELTNHKVKAYHLTENLGGSGGFHFGLNEAMKTDCEWFWLSDDDAFPQKNCFSVFRENITSSPFSDPNTGAICAKVINNGEIDYFHRRRIEKYKYFFRKDNNVPEGEYSKKYFPLDIFSYVGVLIKKSAIHELGLTEKDYFILFDDSEHGYRISRKYNIYCIPEMGVIHDATWDNKTTWKKYYSVRNRLLMYRKHHLPTFIYLVWRRLGCLLPRLKPSHSLQMKKAALLDAIQNKKGLHKIYRPGMKG